MKRIMAVGSMLVATAAMASPAFAGYGGHHNRTSGTSGNSMTYIDNSQNNSANQSVFSVQKSVSVNKGGGFGFAPSAGLAWSGNIGGTNQSVFQLNK